MAQIEYTKEEAYSEMMQALINISGHSHMIQGWYDSLFPIKTIWLNTTRLCCIK